MSKTSPKQSLWRKTKQKGSLWRILCQCPGLNGCFPRSQQRHVASVFRLSLACVLCHQRWPVIQHCCYATCFVKFAIQKLTSVKGNKNTSTEQSWTKHCMLWEFLSAIKAILTILHTQAHKDPRRNEVSTKLVKNARNFFWHGVHHSTEMKQMLHIAILKSFHNSKVIISIHSHSDLVRCVREPTHSQTNPPRSCQKSEVCDSFLKESTHFVK